MVHNNVVLMSFHDVEAFAIRTLHAVPRRAGIQATSISFKRQNTNDTMDPPTVEEADALIGLVRK